MIRADNISRSYGRFEAVSRVSFSVAKGEVAGLLGQNGAGKSTLMNILAGCLAPTAGRAAINGFDLADRPFEARGSLGYLPETPPVYPELTVLESLRFCCRIKGVLQKDEQRHIEEILSLTGLNGFGKQLVGSLSKGYRQRVGLAQALCGDPEVLLLDEPAAGFDPAQALEFRKLIKKLARDKAILLSSHLLGEVRTLCDRVLILHQGRLMLDHNNREASLGTQYRLALAGTPARLLSPIRQLGSVRRAQLLSSQAGEVTRLLVETEPGNAFARQLFTLLSGLNAPILEMVPEQDSLEALFLKVTGPGGVETP